ncbi:MAG: metallophosphoesterase, partial [Comamonadaceae bacterium]
MSLFLLSALLHAYVGLRILPALPGAWAPAALALLLVAGAACTPLGLVARRHARQPLADRLTWVGLVFMGLLSSMLVLTLLRDAALLAVWAITAFRPGSLPGAGISLATAVAVPALGSLLTLWGLVNARRTARTVTVEVPIAGLPAALQGFTIAQISDIHVGPTIKGPYLQSIVEQVNRMEPDLVAITGDLVDGSVAELGAHVAPLA